MRPSPEVHDRIADLLAYPAGKSPDVLAKKAEAVARLFEDGAAPLLEFAAGVGTSGAADVEELYTRTFDHNPERALEAGWHAFGETYARGSFLVAMRERMRAAGVPESGELPDHLTLVLAVLGRLPPATAAALSDGVLRHAVKKMIAGFREPDNPYRALLRAALTLIESSIPVPAGVSVQEDRHE